MDIKITEKLKEFRNKQGNTQEELANHLSISVQAVSKWERGESFPDISLLPAIALFYHTSVDELLGCGEIERDKRINEYKDLWLTYSQKGKTKDAIAILRDALHEFPNHNEFLYHLLFSLAFTGNAEYLDECVEIGQKILNHKNNCNEFIRFSTIHQLATVYKRKGNIELAKQYADMLPDYSCTKGNTLEVVLTGEERRLVIQTNIQNYIHLIDVSIMRMMETKDYSIKDRIFALQTVASLYDLFLLNEMDYALYPIMLTSLWSRFALCYAEQKDAQKTIDALCKMRSFVLMNDAPVTGRCNAFFSDCLNAPNECSILISEIKSHADNFRNYLSKPIFDFVRDTKEWETIIP